MKFSLGKMFVAVAMLAMACAALMYRNFWWAGGVMTLTWGIYVAAFINAIAGTGRRRITSIAFAMAGLIYILLVILPVFYGDQLITNLPLAVIAKELTGSQSSLPDLPAQGGVGVGHHSSTNIDLQFIFQIGHCVFSWLFAILAAWFAGRLYDKRSARETNP